jgi:hypothetical protein
VQQAVDHYVKRPHHIERTVSPPLKG